MKDKREVIEWLLELATTVDRAPLGSEERRAAMRRMAEVSEAYLETVGIRAHVTKVAAGRDEIDSAPKPLA